MFDYKRLNQYLPDEFQFETRQYSEHYYFGNSIIRRDELNMADFTFPHKQIAGLFDITAFLPNAKRFFIRHSSAKAMKANMRHATAKCPANKIPLVCVIPDDSRKKHNLLLSSTLSGVAIIDMTGLYRRNNTVIEWLLYFASRTKGSHNKLSKACENALISMLNDNAKELFISDPARLFFNGSYYRITEIDKLVESAFPLNCDYFYKETSYAYKTVSFSHFLAVGMGVERPNVRAAPLNLEKDNQLSLFNVKTIDETEERLYGELSMMLEKHGYLTTSDIAEVAMRPPFGFSFNNIECYALGCVLMRFRNLLFQDLMSLTYPADAAAFQNHLSVMIKECHTAEGGGKQHTRVLRQAKAEFFFPHSPYIDLFIEKTSQIFGSQRDGYLLASVIMDMRDAINSYQNVFYFIEDFFRDKGEDAYASLTNLYYRLCAASGYSTFPEKLGLVQSAADIMAGIDTAAYRAELTEENIRRGMDIHFNGMNYEHIFSVIPQAGRWVWNKETYDEYAAKGA